MHDDMTETTKQTTCDYCGKSFPKKRPDQHFCSATCRDRFWARVRKLAAEQVKAEARGEDNG